MFRTLLSRAPRGILRNYSSKTVDPIKITFFTKETCSLCTKADKILTDTLTELDVPVTLTKVDIMDPKNEEWYDKYGWDVPVLHVEKPDQDLVKFMHYFFKDKLLEEFKK